MQADMVRKLAWALLRDSGSFTNDDVEKAIVEADPSTSQAKAEQQTAGVLRDLSIQELITEQTGSDGQRFWIATKKAQQRIKREERKLVAPERGDEYEVVTRIRLKLISLAGSIPADSDELGRTEWPRNEQGHVVLWPSWWKGLFRKVFDASQVIPHYVSDWLMFDPIELDVQTGWVKIPVPPQKGSNQGGRGVNVIETLPVGTEIEIRSMWSGRAIVRESILKVWQRAGRTGFSPGKSKLGYGQFEVLDCEVVGDVSLSIGDDDGGDSAPRHLALAK